MKKLRISKIWIAVIVIVVIAVAAWMLSGGKKEEEINFKEEAVKTETLQNSVTATGTIEAVTSVTVGTQVSGIVNKLYVDYNSQVKKGQVIAELDKTNLLSELNTAKANLASATSNLSYQAANMNRYQTLYKKGLVSADEYENALLTYRQAKEQVASSKENVQKAQTNLGYATITSPIDGTVGAIYGTKDPAKVETQLRKVLPPEESNDFCHRLVLHGRAVCMARRPDCQNCTLRPWCDFFQKGVG